MNKQDLIEKAVTSMKQTITHADAERYFNAIFNSIKEAVSSGEEVQVGGFGTFKTANRAARFGRNPKTGETVMIPAKKAPAFKAGKAFKELVNG